MAGALFSAALLGGTFVGARAPVGGSTLNLLPTTTSVKYVDVACSNPYGCATATVTLEAVSGLLVTPSGTVTFTDEDVAGWLDTILGLWSETCTATLEITPYTQLLACAHNEIVATYSGSSDLLAEPSQGRVNAGTNCL